jgi:hypothetical protein
VTIRIARHTVIPDFMSVRVIAPKTAAVAIPWYLSGGITAANCLAAYTPKGAASLAASYDNNAAPGNGLADGTYDCTLGTAPSFDAATGWSFLATSSQYLKTGFMTVDSNDFSAIVRFSDRSTNGMLFGVVNLLGNLYWFGTQGNNGSNKVAYGNTGVAIGGAAIASGTLGFAGLKGFKNGSYDVDIGGTYTFTAAREVYVGCRNLNGSPNTYQTVKIQALAIYNTTLSAPQILAVSTAMAAL